MAETQDKQQGSDPLDLRNLIERLPALVLCTRPDGFVEFANRVFKFTQPVADESPT